LEQALEKGIENFVDAGNALSEIRDKRLYRFGFDTFEDYCQKRWQLSRSYAYRLIEAAGVVRNLSPIGNTPTHESQVRPLSRLEPAQQRQA